MSYARYTWLGPNTDSVSYKEFENAVVKVLSQNENELSRSIK